MTASELYRAGRLNDAIDAQVREVKANPADPSRRVFLFELLCFAGALDRARKQIDAVDYGESQRDLAVSTYRKLIDAEEARRAFFANGVPPEILGEETPALKLRLEALGHLRLGRHADAAALLAEADDAATATPGVLNGTPFSSLRDADDRFGGVLEVLAQGKYFWVDLSRVVALALNPPRYPRDLIYAPARLDLAEESGEVFLPVLYPGSHEQADEMIRLGRLTDWTGPETGPVCGLGARVFAVDDDAIALSEWRTLARGDEPAPE